MENYVEVDGQKFVDDGTGSAKLGEDGQPIPFVEEKQVPYSRFKEVIDERKKLEEEINSLKAEGEKKGGLSSEEQKQLDAKVFLKNLLKETLEEQNKSKAEQEQKEQKEFEQEITDILAENTDVKKKDFLDFIEKNSDEFGIKSVSGAMKLYKHLDVVKKSAIDEEKKKPFLPTHEGGGGRIEPKAEDKGKSITQITNEIQNELRKK